MARILIINHIKEEREEISEILRKENFETVMAETGKEALRTLEKDGFDLVVIDVMLHKENGLKVLEEIRNRDPDLCIIIITMTTEAEKGIKALRLGAYDFVERPIRKEKLTNSAKRCLERRILVKKLNNANSLLDAVLSGIGEGVIVVDRDLKIHAANRGYLERINSKKEDVVGRHCYEVSHHYEVPCKEKGLDCPVLKTFETGERASGIHRHYDTHGNPFYVEVNAYPIRDEKGEISRVVETIMDITERVRLEEETKKRIKELEVFYDMAVGRELKMAELKKEIEGLKEELRKYKKQSLQ